MVDRDAVKRNVAARKLAESLMELAESSLEGVNQERLWLILAEAAGAKCGRVLIEDGPKNRPMSDKEAHRFECLEMPSGIHKGTAVGQVPVDYLDWMVNNEFQKDLRRYVLSGRFKDRGRFQGGCSHAGAESDE